MWHKIRQLHASAQEFWMWAGNWKGKRQNSFLVLYVPIKHPEVTPSIRDGNILWSSHLEKTVTASKLSEMPSSLYIFQTALQALCVFFKALTPLRNIPLRLRQSFSYYLQLHYIQIIFSPCSLTGNWDSKRQRVAWDCKNSWWAAAHSFWHYALLVDCHWTQQKCGKFYCWNRANTTNCNVCKEKPNTIKNIINIIQTNVYSHRTKSSCRRLANSNIIFHWLTHNEILQTESRHCVPLDDYILWVSYHLLTSHWLPHPSEKYYIYQKRD